ncbi:hypothetical protein H4S06_001120 [Coemansia sp. BCRC 34490]|nr:hypothetical protein H4S06_001120 [Coemansia sp. BCRC 34490]
MNASLLKLQNTEVVVGLAGNHALARPGDTSKYFTRLNGSATERVYVDGCTGDSAGIFAVGNIQSFVKHAVEGGTSAVFLSGSGITRMGDYDRKPLMTQICRSISECMARFDPDLSMTYAFVGVTDNKVIDFHRDRNINVDKLRHGLADLQHEVDDWEIVESKILRGATLPFVLSLHFESMAGIPTNGHLCIVDLNVVDWSPTSSPSRIASNPIPGAELGGVAGATPTAMSNNSRLQQSIRSLSSMIHLLANDAILTGVTIPNNALVNLVGEFLYGESKTAFVIYQNTDEAASHDLETAIELIKSLRKLKSREIIRTVDRRVLFFYEKAKYYQGEKYRLQDELADTQEEKEQLEKDLDDIQRDFSEERDALFKEVEHWQNKSKALEGTMEALKTESAGLEADARWENAKLVTEKLAIKDELRRAEIEMTAAEDAKSQLLDLYENLQTSYGNLDSVYSELLEAYRLLKDKYGLLSDERANLQLSVADLEQDAQNKAQLITSQKADIALAIKERDRHIEGLEEAHAQQIEELETQLDAETRRTKELSAKIVQLETKNKSLAVSQTEEVATLQSTVDELSLQLEETQRQMAGESSAMSATLRATEKKAKRLEAEKSKMQEKIEDLIVRSEGQAEFSERESQWEREREQTQRQIKRLQQTAQNAERREAELREESEQQWSAWEAEKNRSHQKYLQLKERLRDAVENSASAARFDLDGEDQEDGGDNNASNGALHKVPKQRGEHQSNKTATRPVGVSAFATSATAMSADTVGAADRATDDSDVEMMDTSNDKESGSVTSAQPPKRRTAAMRPRKARPNYVESDGNDDDGNEMFGYHPPNSGAETSRFGDRVSDITTAAAHGNGGNDSDDSEITFNAASMTPVAERAPAKKQRRPRAAPRQKKSAQELNAEISTQPARKRPGRPPRSRQQAAATAASDRTRNGVAPLAVSEQESLPVAAAAESGPGKPPSPKRKRALGVRASRKRVGVAGSRIPAAHETARDVAMTSEDSNINVAAATTTISTTVAATANALKKKRKLNLSRMRSLLGINADRPTAPKTLNPQAVKFSVPKIRGAGSSLNTENGAMDTSGPADQDDSD